MICSSVTDRTFPFPRWWCSCKWWHNHTHGIKWLIVMGTERSPSRIPDFGSIKLTVTWYFYTINFHIFKCFIKAIFQHFSRLLLVYSLKSIHYLLFVPLSYHHYTKYIRPFTISFEYFLINPNYCHCYSISLVSNNRSLYLNSRIVSSLQWTTNTHRFNSDILFIIDTYYTIFRPCVGILIYFVIAKFQAS